MRFVGMPPAGAAVQFQAALSWQHEPLVPFAQVLQRNPLGLPVRLYPQAPRHRAEVLVRELEASAYPNILRALGERHWTLRCVGGSDYLEPEDRRLRFMTVWMNPDEPLRKSYSYLYSELAQAVDLSLGPVADLKTWPGFWTRMTGAETMKLSSTPEFKSALDADHEDLAPEQWKPYRHFSRAVIFSRELAKLLEGPQPATDFPRVQAWLRNTLTALETRHTPE